MPLPELPWGSTNPAVDPSSAPIVNVTAPGEYPLWAAQPAVYFGWSAPFAFLAKRIQIDSTANLRFYLRGDKPQRDDGTYYIDDYIAASGGLNIAPYDPILYGLVGGTEITARVPGPGLYPIFAYNLIDRFWHCDDLIWVTAACTYGITPPSRSFPWQGGAGTINVNAS